jgi:hypothetical protein
VLIVAWRQGSRGFGQIVNAMVSTGRLELSNSIQRLFSQRRRVARDCDLADALDVRHTTVERRISSRKRRSARVRSVSAVFPSLINTAWPCY